MEDILNEKMKKIRDMKNPTIVMNNVDFLKFENQIDFKSSYIGIPIIINKHIETNNIIIFDDIMKNNYI